MEQGTMIEVTFSKAIRLSHIPDLTNTAFMVPILAERSSKSSFDPAMVRNTPRPSMEGEAREIGFRGSSGPWSDPCFPQTIPNERVTARTVVRGHLEVGKTSHPFALHGHERSFGKNVSRARAVLDSFGGGALRVFDESESTPAVMERSPQVHRNHGVPSFDDGFDPGGMYVRV